MHVVTFRDGYRFAILLLQVLLLDLVFVLALTHTVHNPSISFHNDCL